MAFKGLKQKWLQQFQEQQEHQLEKLKSDSSTLGGEGSTQHQAPAADTASKPTPPQRVEQSAAKTSTSQAADRLLQQGAGQGPATTKKRPPDATRAGGPASEMVAKRKREEGAAVLDAPVPWAAAPKLPSPAAKLQQEPPLQQSGRPLARDAGAKPGKREAGMAAAPDAKQHHLQPKPKLDGSSAAPQAAAAAAAAAAKAEVASAGSNPSTSATKDREGVEEAASAQPRVKQEECSAPMAVPVDVEPRPSAKAQYVGEMAVALQGTYEEFVAALQAAFVDKLPKKAGMRVVYQDMDGDWLLLLPDGPWQLFATTVRRLLVTYK